MSDQKEMKKRLKVLMQKPENQVCSDCPERQPRWASLIVPPPGSPPGSTKIGAFCCLECSGSHRRLGVHISFVRSVNLDSWKEAEVLAMENGGNKKVNAIWEANLQRAGGRKPATGADLTTRERYVRDKYERRRFYDPQALVDYQSNEPSFDDIGSKNQGGDFANFGPPADAQVSDAAKMRAEKKKKKGISRKKSFEDPPRTKAASDRRRPKKQESEPQAVVDLLDLGGGAGSGGGNPAPNANGGAAAGAPFADFFSTEATNGFAAPPAAPTMEPPRRKGSRDGSRSGSSARDQMRTKSKTPDRETTRMNQQQDILNMYNTPTNMGGASMNPAAAANNQVNMMAMMQQMQQMNMNASPQQQMGVTPAGAGGGKHNSRLAMHQNLMMQQMQQQQQNMQQMQRMMQQQPGGGMNPQMAAAMNPQMMQLGGMNPQMMQQAMMQANAAQNNNKMQGGMPQMNVNPNSMMMGMNPNNTMMGMNPSMMMMQQPNNTNMNQFGGMPMGGSVNANSNNSNKGNQAPEKEDPFAQFGMNAFR